MGGIATKGFGDILDIYGEVVLGRIAAHSI